MKVFISLVLLLLVTGCGKQEAQPPSSKPQKTLIDDQLKVLDKAKGVEDTVLEGAERKRKAIEAAGG